MWKLKQNCEVNEILFPNTEVRLKIIRNNVQRGHFWNEALESLSLSQFNSL